MKSYTELIAVNYFSGFERRTHDGKGGDLCEFRLNLIIHPKPMKCFINAPIT